MRKDYKNKEEEVKKAHAAMGKNTEPAMESKPKDENETQKALEGENFKDMEETEEKKGGVSEIESLLEEVRALRQEIYAYSLAVEELEQEKMDTELEHGIEKALVSVGAIDIDVVKRFLKKEMLWLGEDGEILGINEQLDYLMSKAPGLFSSPNTAGTVEESQIVGEKSGYTGGMGKYGRTSSRETAENPWSEGHFNLTKQAKIYGENPEKARLLIAAAKKMMGGYKASK